MTTSKAINRQARSILEINLNDGDSAECVLPPAERNLRQLIQKGGGPLPAMPGFVFGISGHQDAKLCIFSKSNLVVATCGVAWGDDLNLWEWLLDYRDQQFPWIPGGRPSVPRPAQCPWSAVVFHLGMATLNKQEVCGLETFWRQVLASLIHEGVRK